MKPVVIVSVHDVAPATFDAAAPLVGLARQRGLRTTLLVVPGPYRGGVLDHAPEFTDWLHRTSNEGHEIALHGWEHRGVRDPEGPRVSMRRFAGRRLARGCAEFLELSPTEALRRVTLGRQALARIGFDPIGFVPPGWLASPSLVTVLRRLGFAYTTSQWTISDLRRDRTFRIAAISQRPGSPLAGAAAVVASSATTAASRSNRSLRVALHPDDLSDPRSRDATIRVLDDLDPRRCTTYADFVDSET